MERKSWVDFHVLFINRTPTGRRQPVAYLQSVVKSNPGQPETNPNQGLERDLDPGQPHANSAP